MFRVRGSTKIVAVVLFIQYAIRKMIYVAYFVMSQITAKRQSGVVIMMWLNKESMINRSGRIAASSIEQAVEQIPDDVAEPRIWWTGQWINGLMWMEWRGWQKEG